MNGEGPWGEWEVAGQGDPRLSVLQQVVPYCNRVFNIATGLPQYVWPVFLVARDNSVDSTGYTLSNRLSVNDLVLTVPSDFPILTSSPRFYPYTRFSEAFQVIHNIKTTPGPRTSTSSPVLLLFSPFQAPKTQHVMPPPFQAQQKSSPAWVVRSAPSASTASS